MKEMFLNYCMNRIKTKENDKIKLEEIKYGLESFYTTITKAIFIIILSIILNTFTETILLLLFFNIMRLTSFGMHASKSYICWISSIAMFNFLPILLRYITIEKYIVSIIVIVLIFLYAPADTKKHPLVNKIKRKVLKYISTINTIILCIIAITINNSVSNLIMAAIISEVVLILPITYKIFHLEYNNYKKF